MARRDIAERFAEKVDRRGEDECWLWTAGRLDDGYGRINSGGKRGRLLLAHRVAYELEHGPIPHEDLFGNRVLVLHACDTPACVNPAHLFLGTTAANVADMDSKGRRVQVCGERHGEAKVTEAIVREIRGAFRGHRGEIKALAQRFSISQSQVSNIVHRRQWRHVA